MILQEYAMDGTLRWERDDLFSNNVFKGFVVGRDGRVIVVGIPEEGYPPAPLYGKTEIVVLSEEGEIQHRETFEVGEPAGFRFLLAMDGTLYFMSSSGGPVLVAVQTPVPGPQPGDTGWLLPWGRTAAQDWWAP
jgi:hypothetical protein